MAAGVAVDGRGRGSLAMRQPGEPMREQLLWGKDGGWGGALWSTELGELGCLDGREGKREKG